MVVTLQYIYIDLGGMRVVHACILMFVYRVLRTIVVHVNRGYWINIG